MADAWDDEDFAPPPVVQPTVKASWDEEEVEKAQDQKPADDELRKTEADASDDQKGTNAASLPVKPKKLKKQILKDIEQKKGSEGVEGKQPSASSSLEEEDALAKKLRLQRLQEAADYENTKAMFEGIGSVSDQSGIPKNEEEYIELAKDIAKKFSAFEKSFHYVTFFKVLLKEATLDMSAEHLKELSAALTILSNEKLKAEKDKTKKKKTGPTKSSLKVERGIESYDDNGSYGAGGDDYDFM